MDRSTDEVTETVAAQETLLELLSKLVNDYEEELYPTPDVPRDMLQHFLESSGKSQAEFARTVGIPPSTISEVLKGKRSISVENAYRLAEYFHVDPMLFFARREFSTLGTFDSSRRTHTASKTKRNATGSHKPPGYGL